MMGGGSTSLRRVPGTRRVVIAESAGRRGRHVQRLAGTSDWRRGVLDSLGAAAIRIVGIHHLRRAQRWSWPDLTPEELTEALAEHLPSVQLLGAVMPRQLDRPRLSLLVECSGTLFVVKLGPPDTGIEREMHVLTLLEREPLPCVATPRVRSGGRLTDGCMFVATTAIGLDKQWPAVDEPLRMFEADLARCLRRLERPPDAPPDFVPVHGDLTPWNLRRTGRGLALFDWESAGWGPAGSDIAHYREASASLPGWHR